MGLGFGLQAEDGEAGSLSARVTTADPRFKLSVLLDPALDSELGRLPKATVWEMFTSHVGLRGAEPSEDIEPSLSSSTDYGGHNSWNQFLAFAVITTWGEALNMFLRKENWEGWLCHAALLWISCEIRVFCSSPHFFSQALVSCSNVCCALQETVAQAQLCQLSLHTRQLPAAVETAWTTILWVLVDLFHGLPHCALAVGRPLLLPEIVGHFGEMVRSQSLVSSGSSGEPSGITQPSGPQAALRITTGPGRGKQCPRCPSRTRCGAIENLRRPFVLSLTGTNSAAAAVDGTAQPALERSVA